MKISSKEYTYRILSKNNLDNPDDLQDFKEAYLFWETIWKTIFTKVGSADVFSYDDFYRQDYIPIIKHNGSIVAAHYYTVFDARNPSIYKTKYFSIYDSNVWDWIHARSPKKLMSMEFLAVHPVFRKQNTGFSIAEVMIQLGLLLMGELKVDVSVGSAVQAAGVDQMAINLNATLITKDVKRGNLICSLLVQDLAGIRNHPNPEVDQFINELWERREYAGQQKELNKKAG